MSEDLSYKFTNYYETLLDNLDAYNGEYASFIDCGPSLFKLMALLLEQEDIGKESRLDLSAAIAYYVVPMDIIPEQIYGPYGYIDDIFLASYVLRKIIDQYGVELINDVWEFDSDVEKVIDDCYNKSTEILEIDQMEQVLKYIGLI